MGYFPQSHNGLLRIRDWLTKAKPIQGEIKFKYLRMGAGEMTQ